MICASDVSVLFNEPKLLKYGTLGYVAGREARFSALQRAEIAEIAWTRLREASADRVSVLFNEPKLLKCSTPPTRVRRASVSVLFNEPKLLKYWNAIAIDRYAQRVSVLFNEPKLLKWYSQQ